MKSLILILVLMSCLTLYSQNIEFAIGLNKNNFFDFINGGPQTSSYTSDLGFVGQIAINDIKADWLQLRLTLSFERYSGKLKASQFGQAGGSETIADIDKSLLSFGFFPVNFQILKRININVGFEMSGLIHEKFEGTYSVWSIGVPYWSTELSDMYDKYSSRIYLGLKSRLAYDIKLTDNLIISIQYSFYYGLSNEFIEPPEQTKSVRHYFCIGIQKKLK